MPYHLLPIIESDLAHLAALATHAFNYESEYEITMALQSHRPTPDSLARTEAEYRKMLRQAADPALCLKVVDDGVPTQKALGCIFAMQYEQSPTALSEDLGNVVWKTEDDREYATLIKRERNMVVLNAFAQVSGPVTQVVVYAVDPAYHGRGLGGLLMRSITGWCEQKGHGIVLLARPGAVPTYKHFGFEVVEEASLPVSEQWRHKRRVEVATCIWQPQGSEG